MTNSLNVDKTVQLTSCIIQSTFFQDWNLINEIQLEITPWICSSIYPQTKICLSYYFLPFTNSSDIATAAKSLQSWPTLCDPIDGSPPGLPIPGILQARTLEWVAISFSNAWKWKVKVKSLGRVWPSATPWTAAYQASPSMGFSRQEHWSGVPF